METVFFVISLMPAGFGAWLLLDFLFWRVQGRVAGAMITGVQEKKSKGVKLPIVSFEVEDGDEDVREVTAEVARIDQFLFILNSPEEGDPTTVIYDKDNPVKVRIYGYMHLVSGVLLFAPLIVAMGFKFRSALLLGQVSYALVFCAIIFGGWAFLKIIQKHY